MSKRKEDIQKWIEEQLTIGDVHLEAPMNIFSTSIWRIWKLLREKLRKTGFWQFKQHAQQMNYEGDGHKYVSQI